MMEEQIRARRLPPLFDGEVNAQNFGEWRKNIVDLYAHECFGVTPPAPREVRAVVAEQNDDDWAGKAEHRKVMLSFDMENGEFSFPVHLVIPKAGRPCPCVVYPSFTPYATAGYQPIEEIVDQGFALAVFCYEDVTRDNEDFTDGLAAMTSRGAADDWGKIGMWAFACSRVLDHLEESTDEELVLLEGKHGMKLDIPQIPELLIDNTDRNRTSPFAFTGNRFEFRAVGSEANCASAMIALNAAVAEQLTDFKAEVDALMEKGEAKEAALIRVIRKYIKICKPIRFDGNGYSDEWKAEAERRGLDCETSCPVIFDNYLSADSIAMFGSTGVMTQVELEARNEVKWETYTKKIQIEARVLGDLAMNHIVPVAIEYQSKLIDNVYKMKGLFSAEEADKLSAENLAIIREISERTAYIKEHVDAMVEARKVANKIEGERAKAVAYHDTIAPMLEQIRYHIDKLELIVDDQMWTLPKYRELLFIR